MEHDKFFNKEDDIAWLFSTHLKMLMPRPYWVKSFTMLGNEDCPEEVALFNKFNPEWDEKPLFNIEFCREEK